LGFGSSSVVVVDVDAAVNGVLPSLTISEVLGGAVAASVWRSGAPKTAVATE